VYPDLAANAPEMLAGSSVVKRKRKANAGMRNAQAQLTIGVAHAA
jgi:hypothetical protein